MMVTMSWGYCAAGCVIVVAMSSGGQAGLEPVVFRTATDSGSMRSYLAGDDALRAADLRAALTDPSIAGIIFATGGSGAQRTLAARIPQLATVAHAAAAAAADSTDRYAQSGGRDCYRSASAAKRRPAFRWRRRRRRQAG